MHTTSKCLPSIEAEKEGKIVNCKKINVCYKVKCKTCGEQGKSKIYFGETSRNIHCRSKEHYRNCEYEDRSKSWMKKHLEDEHAEEPCNFAWSVVNSFRKPMLRQITEAINIKNTSKSSLMNLKQEYFTNDVNGIVLNKKEHRCKECGKCFDKLPDVKLHLKAMHENINCDQCSHISFGEKIFEISHEKNFL